MSFDVTPVLVHQQQYPSTEIERPNDETSSSGCGIVIHPTEAPGYTQQIFIKGINGRTFIITTSSGDTIDHVKHLIQEKTGELPDRLFFSGKQLSDLKTLAEYTLPVNPTFFAANRLPGGGLQRLPFVNMNQIQHLPLSQLKGSVVQPGLYLRGQCACSVAFNNYVWIPKGFGNFNMNKACTTSTCPECREIVTKITNFGVFRCSFSASGHLIGEDETLISKKKKKLSAPDDCLLSFEDGSGSIDKWNDLTIKTKPEPTASKPPAPEFLPLPIRESVVLSHSKSCCDCTII